ncbi:hypothetical protein [Streptomyces olivaceus]|uniref:hypothetical protein n=1 Tax=Streptomyces olivaceus TaxID=47716 RepID=UPI0022EE0683|nr:hypothetical protein [Streptomyces olivaceus]GHI91315.1 hypothetical protein TPA0905_07860 [Streptomyces olivaceus]
MKCGEPMPGGIYQNCDQELKHTGGHAYLRDRWPRVEPAAPDWDVQELLEDATPATAWGVNERSFPIVVTETITRVLWVDAETEDEALAYWADDYCDIPLKSADIIDGYLDFERPDEHQRTEAFRANRAEQRIGPLVPCPDCGRQDFRRAWFHDPYRKCHGPIRWRINGIGKPMREYEKTPVAGTREAVSA